MFVARYTNNPEGDIKRGWSGWGLAGGMPWNSLGEWASEMGVGPDFEDDIEERQTRWINTYGEQYEDWDTFCQAYLEDLAEENDIRYDEVEGCWRQVHHDGLSCWTLEATTLEEAIEEAACKHEAGTIAWAGTGYATIGTVKLAASVEGTDGLLHVFECDSAVAES